MDWRVASWRRRWLVTFAYLLAAVARLVGSEYPPYSTEKLQSADDLMARFDEDLSGTISRPELAALLDYREITNDLDAPTIDTLFKHLDATYDADSSGD